MRHCEPGPPGVDEGGGAGGSLELIGRPSLRSWLSSRELIKGFDIIRYQYSVNTEQKERERETHLVGVWFQWFGVFLPLCSET